VRKDLEGPDEGEEAQKKKKEGKDAEVCRQTRDQGQKENGRMKREKKL